MIEKKIEIMDNTDTIYYLKGPFARIPYKFFLPITLLSGLCSVSNAQAYLQATTVKTIQGTAPYLTFDNGDALVDLNALLGFTMPKQDGSSGIEKIDVSHSDTVINAPRGMRFQDISTLVPADGQLHDIKLTVNDDDGDAELLENTTTTGQMRATWYDSSGRAVPKEELGKKLDICKRTIHVKTRNSDSGQCQHQIRLAK